MKPPSKHCRKDAYGNHCWVRIGVCLPMPESAQSQPFILYQCSQCRKGMREFVEIIGDKK